MGRIGTASIVFLLGCSGKHSMDLDGDDGSTSDAVTGTSTASAATGTSTVSTSTTTSTTTSANPFINRPDVDGEGYCDPSLQDCARGEKCVGYDPQGGYDPFSAYGCFPLDPNPVGFDEPCRVEGPGYSGHDNCDKGLFCSQIDAEGNGICGAYCLFDRKSRTSVCPDGASRPGYLCQHCPCMCIRHCDPIAQDCAEGFVCVLRSGATAFVCVSDGSGREGQPGDPCQFINACDPGLFCANASLVAGCMDSLGCCTEFCDLTLPSPSTQCSGAAQGMQCVPFFEAGQAPPGSEHIGACLLP